MEYTKKEEILKQFYEKSFPTLDYFEQERKQRLFKMFIIESILVAICAFYFCNIDAIGSFS